MDHQGRSLVSLNVDIKLVRLPDSMPVVHCRRDAAVM